MQDTKDYIYIYDENNKQEKVELVCEFELPNYQYKYLIYKKIEDTDYYITRYLGQDIVNTNNNLSAEELKLANEILERIINNA